MTQKVPQPFESHEDAQSLFNELTASSSSPPSTGSPFSLDGFSTNSVLNLFRNETNATLKGEISKMKGQTLEEKAFELRVSTWRDRLDVAIDRVDERIQILANVQAPQKREAERRDEEERRPLAFALLKALRSGLQQQAKEVAKLERELIAGKLDTEFADQVQELLEFLHVSKNPSQLEEKFLLFSRSLLLFFQETYGQKGFQGLQLFLQGFAQKIPPEWQGLFLKTFLKAFQDQEQVQVLFAGGSLQNLSQLLALHEALALEVKPDEPGVAATFQDDSGVILHYFRGLSSTESNMPMGPDVQIPQDTLSSQYVALLAALLVDEGLFSLDEKLSTLVPELRDAHFVYEGKSQEITLGDLLSMKSGLVDLKTVTQLTGTDDDYMTLLLRLPQLAFEPGKETKLFSWTNVFLLARIIEAKTGMSLGALADKKLFGPSGLELTDTQFSRPQAQKLQAVGYSYSEEMGKWLSKNSVQDPLQVFTTPRDMATWYANLMNNRLGIDLERVSTLAKASFLEEDELYTMQAMAAGFSLFFAMLAPQEGRGNFSFTLASNRQEFDPGSKIREFVERASQVPVYGLAFVPYPIDGHELVLMDEVAKKELLDKLLKRFEGSYRSDELMCAWRLVVQKNQVAGLSREYVGLQVEEQELFFIPIELSDDKAIFVLHSRPTCHLSFSKDHFLLHDRAASVHAIQFKKV